MVWVCRGFTVVFFWVEKWQLEPFSTTWEVTAPWVKFSGLNFGGRTFGKQSKHIWKRLKLRCYVGWKGETNVFLRIAMVLFYQPLFKWILNGWKGWNQNHNFQWFGVILVETTYCGCYGCQLSTTNTICLFCWEVSRCIKSSFTFGLCTHTFHLTNFMYIFSPWKSRCI